MDDLTARRAAKNFDALAREAAGMINGTLPIHNEEITDPETGAVYLVGSRTPLTADERGEFIQAMRSAAADRRDEQHLRRTVPPTQEGEPQ